MRRDGRSGDLYLIWRRCVGGFREVFWKGEVCEEGKKTKETMGGKEVVLYYYKGEIGEGFLFT